MARPGAAAIVVALLSLLASCSPGGDNQAARTSERTAAGNEYRTFSDRGVSFRYPRGWSVAGFSTTQWPARLAVASYPLRAEMVEGDCGGWAAVEALPRDGALVILLDYAEAPSAELAPSAEFATRPTRFRPRDGKYANYECFGASTMFRFQASGRALQAHVALGPDAGASLSRQALAVLDSIVIEADGK